MSSSKKLTFLVINVTSVNNVRQNIIDKLTKQSKISFSMRYFRADLLQHSGATVKISFYGTGLPPILCSVHFISFLEMY